MNYLELINKCLAELNYKTVYTFSELTKNDHKKIKNIINIINAEICGYDKWNFLMRKISFTLPANTSEIENPINGRIASLSVDGHKYTFTNDFEDFIYDTRPSGKYSILNDKLLFPAFDCEKTVNVTYYTSDTVKEIGGKEKRLFEVEDDESLIPMPFAEPILVYGTCMRMKANPQHVKFGYWMNMYNSALANLRSKISVDAEGAPSVKMHRC